jgi:hypothetical protein
MRDTKLLTSAESASILECTPENVRKLARQGTLPIAIVVGRGTRLFDRDVVQRLAAERATSSETK